MLQFSIASHVKTSLCKLYRFSRNLPTTQFTAIWFLSLFNFVSLTFSHMYFMGTCLYKPLISILQSVSKEPNVHQLEFILFYFSFELKCSASRLPLIFQHSASESSLMKTFWLFIFFLTVFIIASCLVSLTNLIRMLSIPSSKLLVKILERAELILDCRERAAKMSFQVKMYLLHSNEGSTGLKVTDLNWKTRSV